MKPEDILPGGYENHKLNLNLYGKFPILASRWYIKMLIHLLEALWLLLPNVFLYFFYFQFDEGGLGLPARNYYLNESDTDVVDAYVEYITRVMRSHGFSNLNLALSVFLI